MADAAVAADGVGVATSVAVGGAGVMVTTATVDPAVGEAVAAGNGRLVQAATASIATITIVQIR